MTQSQPQPKPCSNCPFRQSSYFVDCLSKYRRQEIIDGILPDSSFGCHKTTTHDDNGDYVWTDKERPCVGAALLIKRERGDHKANVCFRMAVMAKKFPIHLDDDPADPDCQDVYPTAQSFIDAEES